MPPVTILELLTKGGWGVAALFAVVIVYIFKDGRTRDAENTKRLEALNERLIGEIKAQSEQQQEALETYQRSNELVESVMSRGGKRRGHD